MVILLVIEATERTLKMVMYKEEIKIDAPIMLITAFISLVCNIFSLIALDHLPCCKSKGSHGGFMDSVTSIYKPHGGHDCSSHGHGGCSHPSHDHHKKKHDHHHNHGKCQGHHHHHHEHSHEKGHNHVAAISVHSHSEISHQSAFADDVKS